ncbi:MAG: SRPBCC family protein [Deltaproteobacteria bacterium]|nr:SRPBCC family protein [Deltaproteobacteria bacterium]
MTKLDFAPKPKLDLVFERIVDVPPELVWKAWTEPEHLKKWFCPRPWQTVDAEIDLRPGGIFRTVMRSPEGEEYPSVGCYLEVVANRKLVWTDALGPNFRPSGAPNHCTESYFTAILLLEPHEGGTKYTAIALHPDEEGRKRHEERGFQDGWGKALEQLVELAKTM